MNGNPRRHVIVALALSAILFLVAGDRWNERISAFGPVRPVRKGE
jgi:hypothetical protein